MDANQNMEMFRAFLSQSRSPDPSNNSYFDQQQQPQGPQESASLFLDFPVANPLSSAASSLAALQQFRSSPPVPAPNMCAPSLASYSLASASSLPMQTQALFNQGTLPMQPRRRQLTEQERFLIFVKILFKCLEKSSDPRLKPRAKAVVTECTRGNRMGDTNYMPLQDAVERRLRRQVGEIYWSRAKLYYDQYMVRKGFGALSGVEAQDMGGSIAV